MSSLHIRVDSPTMEWQLTDYYCYYCFSDICVNRGLKIELEFNLLAGLCVPCSKQEHQQPTITTANTIIALQLTLAILLLCVCYIQERDVYQHCLDIVFSEVFYFVNCRSLRWHLFYLFHQSAHL